MEAYDVAVVGAGINGAGIARDAAMRGLKVVVFDKNDACSGTSWASSRLIHGGLRYLEYAEIPLVYESLHERRNLRVIAPHLVKPLRISIPIYEQGRRGPLLIRLGMLAYDLLSWGKQMPAHRMLSREQMQAEVPSMNIQGLRGGAQYYDAQVTFAERLVLENLVAAGLAGASVRLHHEVTGIRVDDGRVSGIRFRDHARDDHGEMQVKAVVNAAGPWVDAVLATAAPGARRDSKPLIGGTKGSHIVVGRFDGAPDDAFYVEALSDGRPFFIIPWNGQLLIGTTDIRYDESLDDLRASEAEIDYLLAETNRVFPTAELDTDDIHYAYAGVRPLPYREKGPESAITRKHIIRKNRDIADGLLSIIGGKLTTYRHLAEQTVDTLGKVLGRRLPPCRTHDTPLPGGWGLGEAADAVAGVSVLSEAGRQRLLDVYGGRAADVAKLAAEEPSLAAVIDDAATVLAAEVVFAIRKEMALTLDDVVFRRMMIGLDADQGRPLYARVAELAGREFGWDARQQGDALAALRAYSASLRLAE
ncbi:MAG: glycerol-3-phosphate dehydrogenase [Woeseiaceae bacterium]|nr:glycerol-3-phosphate dehydrogenase [Woeseiaceae bacterium]